MKNKILVGLTVLMASILLCGTIFAATGKIKIIVDGKEVATDVAPKNENGRVLVPISTISKALGSGVQWNAKTQSVIINSKPDIWNDDLNFINMNIVNIRNLFHSYFNYYNTKETGYADLVTPTFKSDFVDPKTIISKIQDKIIDYRIIDAKFIGTLEDPGRYKFRVEVVKFSNMEVIPYHIEKLQLDIDVFEKNGGYLIDGIWVKGKEVMNSYTVFPGLTLDGRER
ncbi:copper amine oxidase N-terminal domain-containing protein [Paenibacillus sp. Y412MC10]|uniref:copper amine oxidase N-terminal domain-containing protein n=1 Tax=Geobacillus sp. (strain Y412MC10) TaxID=481743 RepID=UPI00164342EF|nr:copper amine oxidase N-terminal domain-containing protein [Paenibacillus sp. Y412MC10]